MFLEINFAIGTGLGLYSVRQKAQRLHGICGMMDGTDDDGGSVFFFAIPYVPDAGCAQV